MDNLNQEPIQDDAVQEVEQEVVQDPIEDQITEDPLQALEGDIGAELESEEEGEGFFLINGKEVSESEVEKWRTGHMMQSDYTKGKQEVAEQRKAIEAKNQEVATKIGQLDSFIGELESQLVGEEGSEDLDDLLDIDPSEYLRKTKALEAKRNKIKSLKEKSSQAKVDLDSEVVQREQQRLVKLNPDWVDASGSTTAKYTADTNLMNSYFKDVGYSNDEIGSIKSANHWMTVLDAARFHASKNKAAEVKQKVKNAPRITKPQRSQQTGLDAQIAQARAELKKTNKDSEYLALQKLLKLKGKK